MKVFIVLCILTLSACGGAHGDDDCFTLRDDQYCKVEKK